MRNTSARPESDPHHLWEHTRVTSYRRQDVLRILQISSRQLQAWERAGLIPQREVYSFQDLGQLRTLRSLREDDVPAASIRDSILAMKAVAGMANPLLEARVVRTGTRLAFRHHGAMVDPIRRQLLFDFERMARQELDSGCPAPISTAPFRCCPISVAFRSAFMLPSKPRKPAKSSAPSPSTRKFSPSIRNMRAACINLGTIYFHLRQFGRAEELYRRATEADPGYVLAYFDLGNVLDELERLDESIAAYLQGSDALAPLCRRALQPGPGLRAQRPEPPGAAPLASLRQARQLWSLGRPRSRPDPQIAQSRKTHYRLPCRPLHSPAQRQGRAGAGKARLTSSHLTLFSGLRHRANLCRPRSATPPYHLRARFEPLSSLRAEIFRVADPRPASRGRVPSFAGVRIDKDRLV